jgi:hypothetical protein
VHVIRTSFGQNLIQTSPQGYALGPVQTDVEAFLGSGDTALWRGVYLEGVGFEGHESLRVRLQQALLAQLEPQPLTEQLRLGKLLVAMDPYNLDCWQVLLGAMRQSQNYRSLSRSYAECREHLAEVGHKLPHSWQEFLQQTGRIIL